MRFLSAILFSVLACVPLRASTWATANLYPYTDQLIRMQRDASSVFLGGNALNSSTFKFEVWVEKKSFPASTFITAFSISSTADSYSMVDMMLQGSSLYISAARAITYAVEVRIEKRDSTTGALDPAFGSGGALTLPYTAGKMASDGSSLFLFGTYGASTNTAGLIEKRSLSTGALVGAFGNGGQVLMDATTQNERFLNGFLEAGKIVALGTLNGVTYTGSAQGRVERRDATTGAYDSSFATVGFNSLASGSYLAVTGDAGAYYVASSYAVAPSDSALRIEKIDRNTGAYDPSFSSSGIFTYHPSTNGASPFRLSMDGAGGLYIADTYFNTASDSSWQVLKLSTATGTLDASFASGGIYTLNPSTSYESCTDLFLDSGSLYLGGYEYITGTDSQWRVEQLSVGAAVTPTPSFSPTVSPTASPTPTQTAPQTPSATPSPGSNLPNGSCGVFTVAGTGTSGDSGNGGPALSAQFQSVDSVVVDAAGNAFISDTTSDRIRRMDGVTGLMSGYVGTGVAGNGADGGQASATAIGEAADMVISPAGDLVFIDSVSYKVRKVDHSSGVISTLAGGTFGSGGDGGPATSAGFTIPNALAYAANGDLYISDSFTNKVRKVSASTGVITTVAGTGTSGFTGDGGPATSARLHSPGGLAFDSAGNLYIADSGNNRIRKMAVGTGLISTVAGNGATGSVNWDGYPAKAVELDAPEQMAFDGLQSLYVACSGKIRRLDLTQGVVYNVCGYGASHADGASGANTSASASDLCIDGSRNLWYSDAYTDVVRRLAPCVVLTPTLTPTPCAAVLNLPVNEGFDVPGIPCAWDIYSTGAGEVYQTSSAPTYYSNYALGMDSTNNGTQGYNYATVHINASGASNVSLSYSSSAGSNETVDALPVSGTGYVQGDGVMISQDGVTWYRVGVGILSTTVNLSNEFSTDGFTNLSDIQVRFSQAGSASYSPGNGGIYWDQVSVTGVVATRTRTPTATVSPVQSATPTATATPSASASPTAMPTNTISPTSTVTLTSTPTPSISVTPTISPTGTVTLTSSPVIATPTPTPVLPDYGASIMALQPVPNPNPSSFAVHLDRNAAEVRLRVYSRAMVLLFEAKNGATGAGWTQVPLPNEAAKLPNGTYFVSSCVRGDTSDWSQPKLCRMVILK